MFVRSADVLGSSYWKKNLSKSKGWKLYLSVQLETTKTPNEAVNTLS